MEDILGRSHQKQPVKNWETAQFFIKVIETVSKLKSQNYLTTDNLFIRLL